MNNQSAKAPLRPFLNAGTRVSLRLSLMLSFQLLISGCISTPNAAPKNLAELSASTQNSQHSKTHLPVDKLSTDNQLNNHNLINSTAFTNDQESNQSGQQNTISTSQPSGAIDSYSQGAALEEINKQTSQTEFDDSNKKSREKINQSTNDENSTSLDNKAENDIPKSQALNDSQANELTDKNPWRFLHPYSATYQISADGDKLGKASRKMKLEDNYWTLEVSTKLKKWFLTLRSREYSKFHLEDLKILSDEFYSITKVSMRDDRVMHQIFDWTQKLETGKRDGLNWQLPLKDPVFDRANHLLQLRADLIQNASQFKYFISYKGKREYYEYQNSGEETISTPFGQFQAIRMNRTRGDESQFSIWMSPELNYFPIKIAQYEQDKPDVTLTLSDLKFNDEN